MWISFTGCWSWVGLQIWKLYVCAFARGWHLWPKRQARVENIHELWMNAWRNTSGFWLPKSVERLPGHRQQESCWQPAGTCARCKQWFASLKPQKYPQFVCKFQGSSLSFFCFVKKPVCLMTRKKELNNSSNRPWPKWAQPNGKLLLPISARLEIGSSGDVNGSKQLAKSDFLRTMANILFPLNVIFQHLVGHTHSLTHAHRFCTFLCIIWAWKILELSRAWDKSWFAWERRRLDALFPVSYFDVSKSKWGNRWTSPEKGPVLFIFRISHDFTQNPREIAHEFLLLVPRTKWKNHSDLSCILEAQKNRLHCSKQGSSRTIGSGQNDWRLDGLREPDFCVVFLCFGKDQMMKLNPIFDPTLPLCSWKVLGLRREHVGMANFMKLKS